MRFLIKIAKIISYSLFYVVLIIPIRGCFKMSCSEKFYIAVTQFQDFETSLAGLLKQALLSQII
jgi:hypothetical protein